MSVSNPAAGFVSGLENVGFSKTEAENFVAPFASSVGAGPCRLMAVGPDGEAVPVFARAELDDEQPGTDAHSSS